MSLDKPGNPFSKAANSIGGLFATPCDAIVDGLSGDSPLRRPKQRLKEAAEDTLKLPFRAIRDISFWTVKKTWKLLSGAVTRTPFIPVK